MIERLKAYQEELQSVGDYDVRIDELIQELEECNGE